jgi:hypothetical protein
MKSLLHHPLPSPHHTRAVLLQVLAAVQKLSAQSGGSVELKTRHVTEEVRGRPRAPSAAQVLLPVWVVCSRLCRFTLVSLHRCSVVQTPTRSR